MPRTDAKPERPPELVWVHPLPDFWVPGEPHIPHQVTPERAAELLAMPNPAFTLTAPKTED